MENRRLRVFQNIALKRNGLKRDEVTREWRNYIMRSLTICNPHSILFG
jgi:hypothetical protein